MSNFPRFGHVERAVRRHLRTGELWFVGRRGAKVLWQRLRTPDLRVARISVANASAFLKLPDRVLRATGIRNCNEVLSP